MIRVVPSRSALIQKNEPGKKENMYQKRIGNEGLYESLSSTLSTFFFLLFLRLLPAAASSSANEACAQVTRALALSSPHRQKCHHHLIIIHAVMIIIFLILNFLAAWSYRLTKCVWIRLLLLLLLRHFFFRMTFLFLKLPPTGYCWFFLSSLSSSLIF